MADFTMPFVYTALAVLVLTVIAEFFLIKLLRAHNVGQKILEVGPNWHKAKEGTPFMGGLGFMCSTVLVMLVFFILHAFRGDASAYIPLSMTLLFAVANGIIGLIDDYYKFQKRAFLLSKKRKFIYSFDTS